MSLRVTTSLGTSGKFPNSEPQFPNLSNLVLKQGIWKLLPHRSVSLCYEARDKTLN